MKLQVTEFEYFCEGDSEWLGPPSEPRTMTLEEAVAYLNEFLDQEEANPGGMVVEYEPHFRLYLWAASWEDETDRARKVVQFVPDQESDKEAMVKALIRPFRGLRASGYHFKATDVQIINVQRLQPPASGRKYIISVILEGNILHRWHVLVVLRLESGQPVEVTRFWDYRRPGWYAPDDPRFGPGLTDDPVLRPQLRDKAIRALVAACEAELARRVRT